MSDLCVRHLLQKHRGLEPVLDDFACLLDRTTETLNSETHEEFFLVTRALRSQLGPLLRKKADVLFPALEAFFSPDCGPLAVLRDEHARLRSRLACLRRAAKSLAGGRADAALVEQFQRAGRAALQILRDQIYKEDRVLFPMVARLLSPEQDALLLQRMQHIDQTRNRYSPARSRHSTGAWRVRPVAVLAEQSSVKKVQPARML